MSKTINKGVKPKKILFILMPDKYKDIEFTTPYNALVKAKHEVDVAGFTAEVAIGSDGHGHKPNLVLDNLTHNDFKHYDALVIPGGPGSSTFLWNNPVVQDIVIFFHEHKKMVAAICHACVVLAQAGILKGKKATVYPSNDALEIYQKCGVQYSDEGCVVLSEDNIITADGPQHAEDFAKELLINL